MSLFTKIIDRIMAALGAVLFLQAPQFIHDYTQILAGHLAEVSWELDQIRQMVKKSDRTLDMLIKKFVSHSDSDIVFQGNLIESLTQRELRFEEALKALSHASPLSKPFLFTKYLEWELIKETSLHFKAGLPLTLEGVMWALIGLIFGYGLFRLLAKIVRCFSHKFMANRN